MITHLYHACNFLALIDIYSIYSFHGGQFNSMTIRAWQMKLSPEPCA